MVSKIIPAKMAHRSFRSGLFKVMGLMLLLSACTSPGIQTSRPPVTEQSHGQPADSTESADYKSAQQQTQKLSTNPAIQSLMDESIRSRNDGNLPQAMAYIERALRLEPKRADLWLVLAQLHLESLEFQAAEQVARKSLMFAKESIEEIRRAWQIIATSLEATGETDQAKNIRQYIRTL